MKRTKLGLLFALSGAMILASCGGGAPKAKKYRLTFHQTEPGEIEDVVIVVTKGKTTNPEVWEQEPDINPKVGYTAAGWEEYDVETMEADLTVVPVYNAIQYTATFINSVTGETIGTDTFTVEDDSLDYPALPTERGYTYAWEDVTISAQNLTVHCDRTANVHTITFYADEEKTQQVGEAQQFTIETVSINEPAVPERDGYDGSWGEYDFACDHDIQVVAHYELHRYYIQFKIDGENVGSPVGYNVSDTWASINKPTPTSITGYTVTWPESVELQYAEQDNPQIVNGVKTANEYTVHYEGLQTTTSVTYDSAYQLEELSPVYGWFNGDVEVAQSGAAWTIASDVTLTKRTIVNTKVLGFEDPHDATLFKIHDNFSSMEIVDGEGINGSKALKISRTQESATDAHLRISKEYLDLVFADPNVKSLSFYAKGTTATNNFRHKQVDAQYVNNNTAIISCYERNVNNYGIATTYKKFYLTRGVYSQMSASDWFIQYHVGAGDLFLDNFQVSTEDYFDYVKDSLEYGYFEKNNDTTWYLRDAASGQANVLITTGNAANTVQLEYEKISDGHRALKINKTTNNTVSIYLRGDYQYSNLPEEGILIDFYTTIGFNAWWENQETGAISNGYDKHFAFATSYNYGVRDSRWHTLHIPKADINSDGGKIMNLKSPIGTMYIDNIRVATHLTESFESAKACQIGEYGYAVGFDLPDATAANNCRDNTKNYIFMSGWNVCTAAEISGEKCSRGTYSLKFTKKNNGTLSINPKWGELMDDDSTLSFDIYSDDATRTTCNTSGTSARQLSFTLGEWCTITLTKADLESDLSRFTTGGFGAGTFYFDNFVLTL